MSTDTAFTGGTSDLPRAGVWRRWLATMIDWIVVILPFQILAVILFALTAGQIQMDTGFYRSCEPASVPQALEPPPPHDSNFATVCHISFFGATTGVVLTVGRTTKEGTTTTNVTQGYMLDRDEKPIHGTAIDETVELAFLAYLVGMIWKTGRTLGARAVKIRVVDAARPGTSGVPLGKVVIRYLAMAIGFVPVFGILIYQYFAAGGSADAMFTGGFFRWFMYATASGALWGAVLLVQIAMKKDPVYDRLAGTAVLKG
jgi:hypothetical protein